MYFGGPGLVRMRYFLGGRGGIQNNGKNFSTLHLSVKKIMGFFI